MANVRQILLKLTGDSSDAKRAIREVAREAQEFAQKEYRANVNIKTAGAEAQLQKLQERLKRLSAQEATPEVKIRMARVVEQIDRLQLKLDRLKHENVNIDVDVKRGAFERLSAGFSKLLQDFGAFIRDGERVGSTFARVGEKVTGVFASILGKIPAVGGALAKPFEVGASAMGGLAKAGIAAVPVIVVLGGVMVQLVQIVGLLVQGLIGLAATLVTLVASLAAAVGGLLALGAALAAALGPVLLVGIVLLKEITQAVQAKKKAEQQHAAALQQVKSAQQQVTAAQQQARTATQNLRDQTTAAYAAMKQSVNDYKDALLGVQSAQLSVKESALGVSQAKRDLRDLLHGAGLSGNPLQGLLDKFANVNFDPRGALGLVKNAGGKGVDPLDLRQKILALQRAELTYKQAVQGVTDAQQRAGQAQKTRNDFLTRGIAAYGPYRAAVNQQRAADVQLARANDAVARAQAKVAAPLKGITQDQLRLANAVQSVEQSIKRAFGPALHASLGGIESFLRSIAKFLGSRDVQSGLKAIGTAFGDIFRSFGKVLGQKDTQKFFGEMSKAGAALLRLGGRGLVAVFSIFETVAKTALPLLLSHGRGLVAMLEGIAAKPDAIRAKVTGALKSFEIWLGVIKNAFAGVAGVLKALKPLGDAKAAGLRDLLGKFAHFANSPKGETRIQTFFRNLEQDINKLPKALDKFLGIAKHIGTTFSGWHDTVAGTVGLLSGALTGKGSGTGKHAGQLFKGIKELGSGLVGLVTGHQAGGPIPGVGSGDIYPAMLEPGEFVIRRAVSRSLGIPALTALNAGNLAGFTALAGASTSTQTINVQTIPANMPPDPRLTGALIAAEMRKRGIR